MAQNFDVIVLKIKITPRFGGVKNCVFCFGSGITHTLLTCDLILLACVKDLLYRLFSNVLSTKRLVASLLSTWWSDHSFKRFPYFPTQLAPSFCLGILFACFRFDTEATITVHKLVLLRSFFAWVKAPIVSLLLSSPFMTYAQVGVYSHRALLAQDSGLRYLTNSYPSGFLTPPKLFRVAYGYNRACFLLSGWFGPIRVMLWLTKPINKLRWEPLKYETHVHPYLACTPWQLVVRELLTLMHYHIKRTYCALSSGTEVLSHG